MMLLLRIVGWVCLGLGVGSAIFGAWAFFDPSTIQLANDADPFGAPPSRLRIAFQFVFSIALAVFGARLSTWKKKR